MTPSRHQVLQIEPGTFHDHMHWYPKALNATIHPLVSLFMSLGNQVIADRYSQMHPRVKASRLKDMLQYQPKYYRWAGADLIHVTTEKGKRQMILIENNSCPSGQKSIPHLPGMPAHGGYQTLLEKSFMPFCQWNPKGRYDVLAVLFDKNLMETSGYAATLADLIQKPVYLVPFFDEEANEHIRLRKGYLQINTGKSGWKSVYAAFRYVTQKPWNRIPVKTKTMVYNPLIACLAGGRNKLIASKAYDAYNQDIARYGLKISTPETIHDVSLEEIPSWIKHFGGQAVIKEPYSNAGQGVYTILNDAELHSFMSRSFSYSRFIVQSMIGHYAWNDGRGANRYFHLGTMPDERGSSYVFDLRMMICSTPQGFRPLSVYSRKARSPLSALLKPQDISWDMLGTNLSQRTDDGEWTTDTRRLVLMSHPEFDTLCLGLDDLIEAYVQSVLSTIAIDRMAIWLINSKGELRMKLFAALNDDKLLHKEILQPS